MKSFSSKDVRLVQCLTAFAVLIIVAGALESAAQQRDSKPAERHKYWIDLDIDFDHRSYTGLERVRWVNRSEKPTTVLYFHLYSNLRSSDSELGATTSPEGDEPRLEILEVRAVQGDPLVNDDGPR